MSDQRPRSRSSLPGQGVLGAALAGVIMFVFIAAGWRGAAPLAAPHTAEAATRPTIQPAPVIDGAASVASSTPHSSTRPIALTRTGAPVLADRAASSSDASPYFSVIRARAPSASAVSTPSGVSEPIVVAIIDSGVDVSHPDLEGRIWQNPAWRDGNTDMTDTGSGCLGDRQGCRFVSAQTADPSCGYQSLTPTGAIDDDNGHGTFVAGIVVSAVHAIGTADIRILPVKVLDCMGEGRASQAAAGIRYAARAGARVIVLSFSGASDIPTLHDAVEEARTQYGALVVASAGNDGTTATQFPSGYPGVLGVGGTGVLLPDGQIDYLHPAPFSNTSEAVSLLAPAVRIMGPVPPLLCGHYDWECLDGAPYAYASGTSYATPLVAAAAALLIAHQPGLSPDEVARQLVQTARPVPGSNVGQLDVTAAITSQSELAASR